MRWEYYSSMLIRMETMIYIKLQEAQKKQKNQQLTQIISISMMEKEISLKPLMPFLKSIKADLV